MKKSPVFLLVGAFIALSSTLNARTIEVSGSDFIPERVIEALSSFALARDDEVVAGMKGSLLAMKDLDEGKADLILVTLPHQDPEALDFPVIPLGYQIAVVAVNKENPIKSLRPRQLAGIYGSGGEESVIARWSDLGVGGAWRNRNIQAAYTNPNNSPAVDMFRSLYLNNEPIRLGIQQFANNIRLESYISNNETSIGILDTLPLSDMLKTVRIETGEGDDDVAFGPSVENINFGDYPLSLRYYICVPRSQYRSLSPYIRFLLSDEVAGILQEEGFIPVLGSIRQQWLGELPE